MKILKKTILFALCLISFSLFAQEKKDFKKKKTYYKSGNIKSELSFTINGTRKIRNGKSFFWYETGELKNEITYRNNKFEGVLKSYWKNGKIKRYDFYKNGKLKKKACFNQQGKKIKYYNFEIPPKFPGGKKGLTTFLSKNLKYIKSNIKERIVIKFNIEVDGTVTNINVIKGNSSKYKNEALRVIKLMPKWQPAYQDGIPVKVTRSLPLIF